MWSNPQFPFFVQCEQVSQENWIYTIASYVTSIFGIFFIVILRYCRKDFI